MARRRPKAIDQISAPYVISPRLLKEFNRKKPNRRWTIIELNLDYPEGREQAKARVTEILAQILGAEWRRRVRPLDASRHHVFVELGLDELQKLVKADGHGSEVVEAREPPGIYKVWPDRELEPYLGRSLRTIKADACRRSYGADGQDIVWAVADSGIEKNHPHFALYDNLTLPKFGATPAESGRPAPSGLLDHRDFTGANPESPLTDEYGHGTHVAGIIAGSSPPPPARPAASASVEGEATDGLAEPGIRMVVNRRDNAGFVRAFVEPMSGPIEGVAPRCKLLSLKVIDDDGRGQESALLAALDYVARVNDDGRWPRIHGVNLSVGYSFEAEWFAAGRSPLCVAVNRLVLQGVVVVAAAGNDGSAKIKSEFATAAKRIGLDQSISDPGNAEHAITVGSTHPEAPHSYGVSYFSSRGPTADGRQKPDLVAPGERILSCASAGSISALQRKNRELLTNPNLSSATCVYREESGTSMAAPHVSGAIAAFLSVRPEFRGDALRVKQIFVSTATDLGRRVDYQGAGLLDLMRAIQSV